MLKLSGFFYCFIKFFPITYIIYKTLKHEDLIISYIRLIVATRSKNLVDNYSTLMTLFSVSDNLIQFIHIRCDKGEYCETKLFQSRSCDQPLLYSEIVIRNSLSYGWLSKDNPSVLIPREDPIVVAYNLFLIELALKMYLNRAGS